MENSTKLLAKFSAELQYSELPENVIERMKACLLDTLGCAFAGCNSEEAKTIFLSLFDKNCQDRPESIWKNNAKLPIFFAVLINSVMSHAAEMDDLHKPSKIHPGCVVVPAILILGEKLHSSGKQALTAMVAGYETAIRIGEAVGTVSHRRRGWHSTATCGVFGSTAASCYLYGMNEEQIVNALGLAGSQSAGLMAFLSNGSSSKRYQVGKAAANGWMSASLARNGFTGPSDVFEAPDGGFFHAFSDQVYPEKLRDQLGKQYFCENVGLKLYACCGHTHQAIDAVLDLKREYELKVEQIDRVEVMTYDVAGVTWGVSGKPLSAVAGQFSFQYVIAAALLWDKVLPAQFCDEALRSDDIYALMQRIEVITDDTYTQRYPAVWTSKVTLYKNDGMVLSKEAAGARGDAQHLLTRQEVRDKFTALSDDFLSREKQQDIMEMVENIEHVNDISTLTKLLL